MPGLVGYRFFRLPDGLEVWRGNERLGAARKVEGGGEWAAVTRGGSELGRYPRKLDAVATLIAATPAVRGSSGSPVPPNRRAG